MLIIDSKESGKNWISYSTKLQLWWYLNDASGECCNKNLDNSVFTKSSFVFILVLRKHNIQRH